MIAVRSVVQTSRLHPSGVSPDGTVILATLVFESRNSRRAGRPTDADETSALRFAEVAQ